MLSVAVDYGFFSGAGRMNLIDSLLRQSSGMSIAFESEETQLKKLRERLRQMSAEELINQVQSSASGRTSHVTPPIGQSGTAERFTICFEDVSRLFSPLFKQLWVVLQLQ